MAISHRTGIPLKGGDERDALTGWRRLLNFKPGERKAAKTQFNRRVRREAQKEALADVAERG